MSGFTALLFLEKNKPKRLLLKSSNGLFLFLLQIIQNFIVKFQQLFFG
jgi:hypothetical protein